LRGYGDLGAITADSVTAPAIELTANNNAGSALNVLTFSDGDGSTTMDQPSGRFTFKTNDGGVSEEHAYVEVRAVNAAGAGYVVIGAGPKNAPIDRFKVDHLGDVEVLTTGGGVIFKSPNGTRYRLEVSDVGALSAAAG
jgi:hypothetical protein